MKRFITLICVVLLNVLCIESGLAASDLYRNFLEVEAKTRIEQAKFLSEFINIGSKPIETLEYLFKKEIPKRDKAWLKKAMGSQEGKSIFSYRIGDTVYIKDSSSKLRIVRFVEIYPHFVLQVDDEIYLLDHSKENYKKLIEQLGNPKKNISYNDHTNFIYLSSLLLPQAEAVGLGFGFLALGIYGISQSNSQSILKAGFTDVSTQLADLRTAIVKLNQIQEKMLEYQRQMVDLQKRQVQLQMAQVDGGHIGQQAKKMAMEAIEKELLKAFNPVLEKIQGYLERDSNLSLLTCKEREKDQIEYFKVSTKLSTDANPISISRNRLSDKKEKVTFSFKVNGTVKNFDFHSLDEDKDSPKFNPYLTAADKASSACIDHCSKNQSNLSLALLQKNKTSPLESTQVDKIIEQLTQKRSELQKKLSEIKDDINSNQCDVDQPLAQGYLGKLRVHFSSMISEDRREADTKRKRRNKKEYCLEEGYEFLQAEDLLAEEKYFQKKGQGLVGINGWFRRQWIDSGPEFEILRNRCRYELLKYLNENPINSDVRDGLEKIVKCDKANENKNSSERSTSADLSEIEDLLNDLEGLKEDEKALQQAIRDGNNEFNVGEKVTSFISKINTLGKMCKKLDIDCKTLLDQSKWAQNYMNDVVSVTELGAISQITSACCNEPYCKTKLESLYQDIKGNPKSNGQHAH